MNETKSRQEFEIEKRDDGECRVTRRTAARNQGLVKLLLSCPVKGWFHPLDRTETTDDVRVPQLG